ncbi:MAG: adenosylcobinamide-GDP ribazoletransferase [Pseudomonadota bacterium]|jgi:adenosylcobinamide-GDP ribazoletransferase
MPIVRRELEYFFGALRFFTRLPVPEWVGHSADMLDHAARYFPLVGIIVGAFGAAVFILASWMLPTTLALLASMAATLLVTGAFHEDGLADAVDGFGGGWSREQVLAIMKDSRIGSHGAIGLVLMLVGKYVALLETPAEWIPFALMAAHAASRFAATTLIFALDYARDDEAARAKPLARRLGRGELATAALFGLAPMLLLPIAFVALALLLAAAVTLAAARYFVARIGGYTGDCLGAAQQLAELAIYFAVAAAAWNFT